MFPALVAITLYLASYRMYQSLLKVLDYHGHHQFKRIF